MSDNFDPSQVQKAYSVSQWALKEDWYITEANSLSLPDDPTPADVQHVAIGIDALLTVARLDYACIHQNYERYSNQLKIEEKRLFVELKQQPPTQFASMKLTVDEMKGVVAYVIQKQNWGNTNRSLYKLVEESSSRNIFIESVIRLLQDKKDLLITHSGILKIEHGLNSLTASAQQGR